VQTSERIRAEQIRSIYRNTPPGLLSTLVAVATLTGVLVYIDAAAPGRAALLVAAMALQTGARFCLYHAYSRRLSKAGNTLNAAEWAFWARWFTVGTIVGGLTLGIGSIWIMSAGRLDLQLIALLLIFACASGAVSAFAAYLPSFYAFFISISIAPVLWLLAQGDVVHTALAGLYVLWFVAVAEQARRSSLVFAESVQLRFENIDLVEDLRREKAVAEHANAAKSRFLAAASHDLRQPVHALSLFVAALRPRAMDDEARGLLDHIDGSVQAMSGLFGGLLDISRLDAGVVEVNKSAVAVQPLLERVCRDYEVQAKAKGLQLRLRRCSVSVNSDPMLLERIVRNVIANAVAYTDQGRVLVGCRRGRQLSIQVCDTGRGIPEHEQEQVFQEFYQLGNPERDRTRGVGLGLAIVRRLTSLLEHPLTVRSRHGKGSAFKISVPYAAAAEVSVAAAAQFTTPLLTRGVGLILVIDDEVAIQLAMRSLLESWGYEVITGGSCAEVLERIALHRTVPRLIICDYRLRDNENGTQAIDRLRSEYNEEIPGMLITGDTAPDRLKEAQESGFLLLHKPVPNSRLRASIAHLVGTREGVAV
jgi:signal transduction histidine kinase/CheY-like chemotaxis protein